MPQFRYKALDPQGKEITGVLNCEDATAAARRIRETGYFTTDV
jgi:type II secretory pathway component PulF